MKPVPCFYRLSESDTLVQNVLKPPILFILLLFLGSVNNSKAAITTDSPVLPPVAVCKNISVQLGTGGTVTISGQDVDGGSYDPDGTIVTMVASPNTFNCSQIGNNSVILTVTDNEGLSSACSATVTVEDRTPPVLMCRNFTVYLDPSGSGSVTSAEINNGSSDNCTSGLFFYLSKTDFGCSDIGAPVVVVLTGTDDAGNSSSCTSQITVLDTVSPVINVKPFNLLLGSSGTATLLPADIDNGTYDNCGSVTLSVSQTFFTCSDLGQKTVTLSALDSHENSSSRNVVINVSSTLNIAGMSLSSCDLSPTLALFDADMEGGDGDYSYFWRGLDAASRPFMVIIPFPPSLQFFNFTTIETPFFNNTMANGLYDIRLVVTDGNGCTDSSEITINKTGAIFNNQTFRYSEACEGEIKIYSVGYKPDAFYSWSVTNGTVLNSDTDTSRINVMWNPGEVQGTIVTTVSEPNILFPGWQCESTVIDTITITPVPTPSFNNPTTNVCSNSVYTYSLTGIYPYQGWLVTGGAIIGGGKVSDNFVTVRWGTGPTAGISVSAGSNSSCTGSIILNVSVFNLSGTITSLADITCNGGSDGSVSVTADPATGMAPYMYSLDGGPFQAGGNFSGISLGNHSVSIRDALLCTFELPFVIDQPQPVSGTVSTLANVICYGGTDGSVTINAAGGVAPYQYQLNGGVLQSSNVFSGLSAGSYVVAVQDSHGCTGSVAFNITQPEAPLNGMSTVTNVICFGQSTGRIDLSVTGGTAPYAFLWNNGSTTEDLINIVAGTYSAVVTDSKGCTITIEEVVTQPATALSGTVAITNVLCFGGTTGAVNLTITGGTSPYSFVWNNGASTEDLLNVPAGFYSVIITDANGCNASVDGSVTEPSAAVGGSIVSQINVSCTGGNNGTVTVSGTGGIAPYEYKLGTGTYQSSGIFGSLTAGAYNITIRDANLCTFALQAVITEPSVPLAGSVIVTNISCFGNNSGVCDLTVTGGTSPYTFIWNNGAVTEDINNLTSGDYSVTVTDSKGCTSVINATVSQPSALLTASITSQSDVSVYGGNDGSITVTGSGGTPPLEYSLNAGAFQASGTFSSLYAGTYHVKVRDANLCTFDLLATITQPWIPLTAHIFSQTNVLCQGGNSGSVTVEGWGGTLPYVYSLNGGSFQAAGTFGSLSAGTYTITVRDAALDLFDILITITEAEPLTIAVSGEDVTCYGGITGSVTAIVTGGTEPYSYIWNTVPVQVTSTASGLPAGTYTVTVSDANGCTASNNVTISQPSADMVIAISQINILCPGGETGSATAVVSGGLAPYTYLWDTTPEQTKETATDLSAGTYNIIITDSHGCRKQGSVNITEPQALTLDSSTTPASCPDMDDGSITLAITGGTGPYGVLWSDEVTLQNRTKLKSGRYSVIVTDHNSCTVSTSVDVDFIWSPDCLVIPQVITPNNDGFNDDWRIKNIDLYPNAEVHVYNRWGKMVFSTKNLSDNPWDGTLDGKLVPTDSYHYILYLNDGSEPRSGVISVIR